MIGKRNLQMKTIKIHSNQWDETATKLKGLDISLGIFFSMMASASYGDIKETLLICTSHVHSTNTRHKKVVKKNHQNTTDCFQSSWYTDWVWLLGYRNYIKVSKTRWISYGKFCGVFLRGVVSVIWKPVCTYKVKHNMV